MNAEILSYSRAQGLFAGINLSGGVLRPDSEDNEEAYGKDVVPATVLTGNTAAPAAMQPFMKALIRK
jgi:lipid-binding SYLF domain-containing protein